MVDGERQELSLVVAGDRRLFVISGLTVGKISFALVRKKR